MKRLMLGFAAAGCRVTALNVTAVNAQQTDPQPTCKMCPGTYLPATEIQEYIKKALAEKRTDQQARDVDIGKAHIGIGVVYRGKLDAPAPQSVAEYDLVSEVYYIMSGSGTLVLGPDIADMKRRPANAETVNYIIARSEILSTLGALNKEHCSIAPSAPPPTFLAACGGSRIGDRKARGAPPR